MSGIKLRQCMPAPTMQMVLTTLADAKLVPIRCFIDLQHFCKDSLMPLLLATETRRFWVYAIMPVGFCFLTYKMVSAMVSRPCYGGLHIAICEG